MEYVAGASEPYGSVHLFGACALKIQLKRIDLDGGLTFRRLQLLVCNFQMVMKDQGSF